MPKFIPYTISQIKGKPFPLDRYVLINIKRNDANIRYLQQTLKFVEKSGVLAIHFEVDPQRLGSSINLMKAMMTPKVDILIVKNQRIKNVLIKSIKRDQIQKLKELSIIHKIKFLLNLGYGNGHSAYLLDKLQGIENIIMEYKRIRISPEEVIHKMRTYGDIKEIDLIMKYITKIKDIGDKKRFLYKKKRLIHINMDYLVIKIKKSKAFKGVRLLETLNKIIHEMRELQNLMRELKTITQLL